MKRIFMAVALIFLATPMIKAQDDVSLDPEFGGRLGFELDKKLSKGLHLKLEEEVRMDENFSAFDRFHTTVALNYKATENIKIGAGYALINPYSSSDGAFKDARHRIMLDAAYTFHTGDWNISIKERLQATFRTGDFNAYQNPQPAINLKSRLQAKYKGFGNIMPYGYIELRHLLNAPAISATQEDDGTWVNSDGEEESTAGWFITGWNKAYMNRIRASVGINWRLDRNNTLNFYLLADYLNNYEVDANAEGTKLKSYTHETGFLGQVGACYSLSF